MNIYGFFQASIEALERWLCEHYSKKHWISDWCKSIENIQVYFEECGGFVGNDYYSFDWKKAAYKRMGQLQTLMQCPECFMATEERECDDCLIPTHEMDEEEAAMYFKDMSYPLPDEALWQSLDHDGWEAYCEGTHVYTAKIKDEILDCLKAIRNAESTEDCVVALMWSLKIPHINGNIADDYMEHFWKLIDNVRTNGLDEAFGKEAAREFMNQDDLAFALDTELIEEVEHAETKTAHNG